MGQWNVYLLRICASVVAGCMSCLRSKNVIESYRRWDPILNRFLSFRILISAAKPTFILLAFLIYLVQSSHLSRRSKAFNLLLTDQKEILHPSFPDSYFSFRNCTMALDYLSVLMSIYIQFLGTYYAAP